MECSQKSIIYYPLAGDINFDNRKSAIDDMLKDPDFGDASSIQGRIWWDKK